MKAVPKTTCSHCGDSATNTCNGCKIHVYCGRECQVKDWDVHKPICKDIALERAVERASELVQQIFFAYREKTFEKSIDKVENVKGDPESGDYLLIHDTLAEFDKKCGLFVDLQPELLEDENVKMAILCTSVVHEPFGFMHDIISDALQGFGAKLEELDIQFNNVPRPNHSNLVDAPYPGCNRAVTGPMFPYHILLVTSKYSGKAWVMDISGPEHGISETTWDWDEFSEKHGVEINDSSSFGSRRTHIADLATSEGFRGLLVRAQLDAARTVRNAIDIFLKINNLTLSRLVQLEEAEYQVKKEEILRVVDKAMVKFRGTADYLEEAHAAKNYDMLHPNEAVQKLATLREQFEANIPQLMELHEAYPEDLERRFPNYHELVKNYEEANGKSQTKDESEEELDASDMEENVQQFSLSEETSKD